MRSYGFSRAEMIKILADGFQRTLRIVKWPRRRVMAVVDVRSKQGAAVKCTVADTWVPKLIDINKTLDPCGRYDAVINAEGLFDVGAQ